MAYDAYTNSAVFASMAAQVQTRWWHGVNGKRGRPVWRPANGKGGDRGGECGVLVLVAKKAPPTPALLRVGCLVEAGAFGTPYVLLENRLLKGRPEGVISNLSHSSLRGFLNRPLPLDWMCIQRFFCIIKFAVHAIVCGYNNIQKETIHV